MENDRKAEPIIPADLWDSYLAFNALAAAAAVFIEGKMLWLLRSILKILGCMDNIVVPFVLI